MEGNVMVDLSRRNILTGSWRAARGEIRPPWTQEDSAFLSRCIRCDACVQACENGILQRGAGGYPAVNFLRGECSFCYACASACPEALFSPRHARAWDLRFTLGEACLAQRSIECRRCEDSCEPQAITFRPTLSGIYQPRLVVEACSGCGACVADCPVSAITVEYNHAH
jgi:ferredoxin-type protein NapF